MLTLYSDVLGAGQGWSKSVLLHHKTREEFRAFFERKDTFTLGVCKYVFHESIPPFFSGHHSCLKRSHSMAIRLTPRIPSY